MRTILALIILALIGPFFTSIARSEPTQKRAPANWFLVQDPVLPDYVHDLQVPEALYHWTSAEDLDRMARNQAEGRAQFPLYDITYSKLSKWNQYRGGSGGYDRTFTEGLFAWEHPVLSLGISDGGQTELYARIGTVAKENPMWKVFDHITESFPAQRFKNRYGYWPDGRPPRLITMQPRKDSRIGLVVTYANGDHFYDFKPKENLFNGLPAHINTRPNKDNVDLVFHLHYNFAGKLEFQEWLIVSDRAIESLTADPEVARKALEKGLSDLDAVGYKNLPVREKHFVYRGLVPEYRRIIDELLKGGRVEVPEFFLQGPTRSCRALFGT